MIAIGSSKCTKTSSLGSAGLNAPLLGAGSSFLEAVSLREAVSSLGRILGLGAVAAVAVFGSLPSKAQAFERQWHLGANLGSEGLNTANWGPTGGVYAAYGLNDYFDVSLSLSTTYHPASPELSSFHALAGIAYKLDVFRWVPSIGVQLGGSYIDGTAPGTDLSGGHLSLAPYFALDYAFSRQVAVGFEVKPIAFLSPNVEFATLQLLLRAEYRFGY